MQVIGVDSVEEFDAQTKKRGFYHNHHRITWWDNSLEGPPPSKKNKNRQQPFWWFGTSKGSAFSPVLEAKWNSDQSRYQVKAPRSALNRTHQHEWSYPAEPEWQSEYM
eukprot:1334830-Karenia_brevis.AAC.1